MGNRRLFWQIVDQIEAKIDSGKFSPGSRLPPERVLAETFNVSRPTVREAIIALEVREKIEVKTGSGVYVLKKAKNKQQHEINAFEVTQARALIEGEVAALAAASINESELEELEETLHAMQKGEYVEEADRRFHHIIAHATRNKAMILAVENLWALRSLTPKIVDDYNSVCSKDSIKIIDEHTAIFNALKQGDVAQARQAMHNHFNRLINALFDAVETKALEEIRKRNSEKRDKYSISNLVNSHL